MSQSRRMDSFMCVCVCVFAARFKPMASILHRERPNCLDPLPRVSSNRLVRLLNSVALDLDRVLPISCECDATPTPHTRYVFAPFVRLDVEMDEKYNCQIEIG